MNILWHTTYAGTAWENLCDVLLGLKHKDDYQPITDKNGDFGLDGIVVCDGIIYQAYGQEYDNKDPVGSLKSKITADLIKLKKNEKEIAKLFGNKKVRKWILLLNKKVPSSELHLFLKEQEKKVKKWKLKYIAENFELKIQPPTYLETEYGENQKRKYDKIEVPIIITHAPEMQTLMKNENFIAVYKKFLLISDTDEIALDLAYKEIKNYIQLSAQAEEIQKRQPQFYSVIEDIRSDVEEEAKNGSLLDGTYSSYSQISNTLQNRLSNTVGDRLEHNTLARFRKFVVADWLVRCPLSFKDQKSDKK